jgi:hypothetical protein
MGGAAAPSHVATHGPFLCALVTRNRWFLASPAGPALLMRCREVLARPSRWFLASPAGPALLMRCREVLARPSRWFLASPAGPAFLMCCRKALAHPSRWFLASPAGPALLMPCREALARPSRWSPLVLRLSQSLVFWRLRRWSRAPVSPVHFLMSLLGPCAREFHWNSAALVSSTLVAKQF